MNQLEANRKWRKKNREKVNGYDRKSYHKNPKPFQERRKRYKQKLEKTKEQRIDAIIESWIDSI